MSTRKAKPVKRGREQLNPRRPFRELWLLQYDWLTANDTRTLMWCGPCKRYNTIADSNSAFVRGTANFNHPAFVKHEESEPHQMCVAKQALEVGPAVSPTAPQLTQVIKMEEIEESLPAKQHASTCHQSPLTTPIPTPQQLLQINWKEHDVCINNMFGKHLANQAFVDVTLACEGKSIHCHKVMLASCSNYFERLLTENPCQHPIIFLKDMQMWQVEALLEFIYKGDVQVEERKLASLMQAAEALEIRGLAAYSAVAISSANNENEPEVMETQTCIPIHQEYDDTDINDPLSSQAVGSEGVLSDGHRNNTSDKGTADFWPVVMSTTTLCPKRRKTGCEDGLKTNHENRTSNNCDTQFCPKGPIVIEPSLERNLQHVSQSNTSIHSTTCDRQYPPTVSSAVDTSSAGNQKQNFQSCNSADTNA